MGDIVLYVMKKYEAMSGMEADYFNVDKRMFHGALAAFNKIYENTKDKKWLEASQLAGGHSVPWDGADDRGRRLSAGIYLFRMRAGSFIGTRRLVLAP